jgi:UDP-N-acetylmuramoylalanine--D-glutamate ligase/glutamate racemase
MSNTFEGSPSIEKVAILGFGIEGKANYEYYSNCAEVKEIIIVDENLNPADPIFSNSLVTPINELSKIPADFTVIRSPGIAPFRIFEQNPTLPKEQIWSSTNEFFLRCRELNVPIIGVTGTKGKGTTSSMIASILSSSIDIQAHPVHLLGNIGIPALSVFPEINAEVKSGQKPVVVFELSSFQLWDIRFSPQIAVTTIFEPDHLNVHKDYDDYLAAKSNIWKYQNSDEGDVLIKHLDPAQGVESEIFDSVYRLAQHISLPGLHNVENASLAIRAVQKYSERFTQAESLSEQDIVRGLENFTGLDHRLKLVGSINDVDFYDDSIATTPSSAIAALRSFNQPKILILGGQDKGGDYRDLGKVLGELGSANDSVQESIRCVILFGENQEKIHADLEKAFDDLSEEYRSRPQIRILHASPNTLLTPLSSVMDLVLNNAHQGDAVLFSPAAASFDLFNNYSERGECFELEVERVRKMNEPCTCKDELARKKCSKVVVFDSGAGGVFVARRFEKMMNNHILYPKLNIDVITDVQNVPYGSKTPDEIFRLTVNALHEYLEIDAKKFADVIVIACNTATANAIERLRTEFPQQKFVGFEPMVKPASLHSETGNIAVLATPATLDSPRYVGLKNHFASNFNIFEPDTANWASLIENGEFTKEHLQDVAQLVKDNNIDQVILACTHYISVKSLIREVIGEDVQVLEPTNAVFMQVIRVL